MSPISILKNTETSFSKSSIMLYLKNNNIYITFYSWVQIAYIIKLCNFDPLKYIYAIVFLHMLYAFKKIKIFFTKYNKIVFFLMLYFSSKQTKTLKCFSNPHLWYREFICTDVWDFPYLSGVKYAKFNI
jgi:hypothetical protein